MKYQWTMVDALAHRNVAAFVSGKTDFSYVGALTGLVIVENGLDQNVSVQVQGRARGGSTWQNVETAEAIATLAAGNIAITEPWPEIRISVTPAGAPTDGTFSAWFSGV